jgi:hypothetical protein
MPEIKNPGPVFRKKPEPEPFKKLPAGKRGMIAPTILSL